jgi:myosin-3
VRASGDLEFSVAHYTGKVTYDSSLICHKNRDFLPPELTDVMRCSTNPTIKSSFTNKLSRTGNVTLLIENARLTPIPGKKRWGEALLGAEGSKTRV